MSSSHSQFLSGTIFGVVLGLVLGHFTLWSGQQSSDSLSTHETPIVDPLSDLSFELGPRSAQLPFYPDPTATEFSSVETPELEPFDDVSPLANAIAVETSETPMEEPQAEPAQVEIGTPAEEPQPLEIQVAAPLEPVEPARDEEIRAIIDRELADIPKSQRDVWFESLRDLSTEDVTGVIRMWKAIGGPVPGLLNEDVLFDPGPDVGNQPDPQVQPDEAPPHPAAAIRQAITIHRQNLLMESTPGFLRLVPRFVEEIVDGVPVVKSVTVEFDARDTSLLVTGSPLDLKIEGLGLFLVKDAAGNQYCTRRGRFSLNKQRQVALIDPDGEYVLQPVLTLPESVSRLSIDQQGEVRPADSEQASSEPLGQLQLALPIDPTQFRYFKNGLLQADNVTLSILKPGQGSAGTIQQGCVQLSNVDAQWELGRIEHYEKLLKAWEAPR